MNRHEMPDGLIIEGHVLDALASLPAESIQCCITSPPYYGLRKYSGDQDTQWSNGFGAYGLERTPQEWADRTLEWLRAVRRVLRKDGVCWINVGSSYAANRGTGDSPLVGAKQKSNVGSLLGKSVAPPGYKPLDLIDPFANLYQGLLADGWFIRSVIIWSKLNPMPESLAGWRFEKHRVSRKNLSKMQSKDRTNKRRASSLRGLQESTENSSHIALSENGSGSIQAQTESLDTRNEGERTSLREILETDPSWQSLASRGKEEVQAVTSIVSEGERVVQGMAAVTEGQSHHESGHGESADTAPKGRGREAYDGAMGTDSSEGQRPLLLLQEEGREANDGSRDSSVEGRESHRGEHRGSLLDVQFEESESDSSTLIDCEGCPKCAHNDGLVLRRGSWRPTSSYEYVIMLAKSASYYSDGEGVREPQSRDWSNENGLLGMGEWATLAGRHDASRTDKPQYNPAGRNLRDVWELPTQSFSGAHFATYPEELVKRCILASTPDAGVCAVCGSPWARIIGEKHYEFRGNNLRSPKGANSLEADAGAKVGGFSVAGRPSLAIIGVDTIGWRPTCAHGEATPATILDPFGGSMTSAVVARSLGRRFVCIELSADYVQMGLRRIMLTQPAMAGLV